jgi:carnitine-CoA ligase
LAFRGKILEHIIVNSGARLIICHSDLVSRLELVRTGAIESMIVVGGNAPINIPVQCMNENALVSDTDKFSEPHPAIEPWDINGIFYTSGTTGPSKGVLCPHLHTYMMAVQCLRFLKGTDRFLVNVPLYHVAGSVVPYVILDRGASMAVLKEFRAQDFWDHVRQTQSTICMFIGTTANFLLKQPARPDDADNPLRAVLQQPVVYDVPAFSRRFGVSIFTGYDMTEMGPPIISDALPDDRTVTHGYCGRLRNSSPKTEIRLVDEFDREVPVGQAGELIARCDTPWVITPGYHNMPEATAKVWRNGWFHTGDVFRRDNEGNYYFVDRVKDSIRRRGENISSAEVETEVLAFEAVESAAAVAVRGEHGEDEVLVAVQPKHGRTIDPVELIRFLLPRMPHFMVPRYIRVLDKMPMTDTDKVQKSLFRAEGVTADTWDREKSGIKVKRERIGR